jgi:hypothetical protein
MQSILGTPYRLRMDRSMVWFRQDTYDTGESDTSRCAGATDTSRIAMSSISGHDYDATCSLCWLGYGHTMDLHADRIQAHKDATAAPVPYAPR